MSAYKSGNYDSNKLQYQSPNPNLKLSTHLEQFSEEKHQMTESLHASTKILVPKISNMHLVTNPKYLDATITEESPRLEAEGPASHKINYFQDSISTARERSLCFR